MKVGDFLYKPTKKGIETLKIEKVGSIYYTVNGDKINKDTLQYVDKLYNQRNYQLYKSEEDIKNEIEYNKTLEEIKNYFSVGRKFNLSLEQLKQIKQIISNEITK